MLKERRSCPHRTAISRSDYQRFTGSIRTHGTSGDLALGAKGTLPVRGSGFEPGETVHIELHWNHVYVLASVVADDFGLAVANVQIPAGVDPGAQEIWLVAPSATATAGLSITTPAAHP